MPQIPQPETPPPYPSGSWDYLNTTTNGHISGQSPQAQCRLKIAIVGAGIGGLSAAIALATDGHEAVVLEDAPMLAEIGAGIQIPPNSARILHSWGLKESLSVKAVRPESLYWKRWQDGRIIGHTRYLPDFERWFGAPYRVVHRAHLHEILHQRAKELGVEIRLGKTVKHYSIDQGRLTLADETIHVDLVVAADGIKSLARRTLNGCESANLRHHNMAAFRAAIPTSALKSDPEVASKVDLNSINLWVGDNAHVMTYGIAGGETWNVVATIPERRKVEEWDAAENFSISRMQSYFEGWDPILIKLLKMATKTRKWPVQDIACPNQWLSPSKTLALLGDAAHAMIPFMSIGAAMAVEDACALAQALRLIDSPSCLGSALDVYEVVRKARTTAMHEASYRHAYTVHLPDGPEQRARDAGMEDEVKGMHFIRSPNQWSDPTTQIWAYDYDSAETIREAWSLRGKL